jgi:hypothetical protein
MPKVLASVLIMSLGTSALAAAPRPMGDLAKPMTDETAECIVKDDPKLIESWFGTLPGSSEERRIVSRRETRFSRCFRTNFAQMRSWAPEYDYPSLRVGILRFLIRSGIVDVPARQPPGLSRPMWFANAANDAAASANIIANDLGFCLAKTDWPTARTVIVSLQGSKAEAAALRKLVPLIGGCIPPGAKLRMDLPRVRAILEETAYHAVGGVTAATLASASYPSRSSR